MHLACEKDMNLGIQGQNELIVISPDSYVEALSPKAMVFGDEAFGGQ